MEISVKVLLSLALIVWGLVGLVRMRRESAKRKEKIVKQAVANYIIAKDALVRSDLDVAQFADAVEHLTDNTIDIVIEACGTKYVDDATMLIREYEDKQEKKRNGTDI